MIISKISVCENLNNSAEYKGVKYISSQKIIDQIYTNLKSYGFPIFRKETETGTKYTITGSYEAKNRITTGETLKIQISPNGTISMKRNICIRKVKKDKDANIIRNANGSPKLTAAVITTESMEAKPGNPKDFKTLCLTLASELQRFNNRRGVLMTHLVFEHNPVLQFSKTKIPPSCSL